MNCDVFFINERKHQEDFVVQFTVFQVYHGYLVERQAQGERQQGSDLLKKRNFIDNSCQKCAMVPYYIKRGDVVVLTSALSTQKLPAIFKKLPLGDSLI